jgi:phosphate transport system substrate-binding protein
MRQRLISVFLAAVLLITGVGAALVGCSNTSPSNEPAPASGEDSSATPEGMTGAINVYSREEGSGTRGAFVELFGVMEPDSNGKDVDATVPSAAITNSTSVMMTSVAGDPSGIGYISLGSLNNTVKALEIDGTEATVANVVNGSYTVVRPFNIVTRDEISEPASDFINFIMSSDGQAIVEENGYIPIEGLKPYASSGATGKAVVAGSSSVTPVMEKLQEAYAKANSGVTIEVQQSDSTTGVNMTVEGTCDIGMASRELKDSEISAGVKATEIATDGIAVIVNNDASLAGLTKDQVKEIFLGAVTRWEDAAA